MQLLADYYKRSVTNMLHEKKMLKVPPSVVSTTATGATTTLLGPPAVAQPATSALLPRPTKAPAKRQQMRDFNALFVCPLCDGYMINPTSIEACAHNYCRSCILKHLLGGDNYCPQCRAEGGGGDLNGQRPINETHLRADDGLRAVIFKLVPGLYQQERERLAQFAAAQLQQQNAAGGRGGQRDSPVADGDDDFFSPTEPISLSLEYHPTLLQHCSADGQMAPPPVRYLQCPAGVKMLHLQRFLCSKYNIDPLCRRVDVQVIYEEEVLPYDFSLMDVAYCYNWKRHAPMRFHYRILIYDGAGTPPTDHAVAATNSGGEAAAPEPPPQGKCQPQAASGSAGVVVKSVSFADERRVDAPLKSAAAVPVKPKRQRGNATANNNNNNNKPNQVDGNGATLSAATHDFKSLRSNDMRYSDYAASSSSSTVGGLNAAHETSSAQSKKAPVAAPPLPPPQLTAVGKCDILVSIPHSQLPRSPYSAEELYENVSLAQLKTASKKSPPSASSASGYEPATVKRSAVATGGRNVPKLKIELNSLRTKLSIPKPKSADALHEKRARQQQLPPPRKHSLDERAPAAPLQLQQLDLQTYAKEIGLKPIKVLTPSSPEAGVKYSPNASPMSTSSLSSTNSTSSNGNSHALGGAAAADDTGAYGASTSTHKKRKKKHSKDAKELNGSGSGGSAKRRKLHAEISSQPAGDESLKMKVKITNTPVTHKQHKLAPAPPPAAVVLLPDAKRPGSESKEELRASSAHFTALNKTLCEESQGISAALKRSGSSCAAQQADLVKAEASSQVAEPTGSAAKLNLLTKPLASIKHELKLPASPPLPPSLFKTTALTFPTLTPTATAAASSGSKLSTVVTPTSAVAAQRVATAEGGTKEVAATVAPKVRTVPTILPKPALQAIKPAPPPSGAAKPLAAAKSHFVVPHPPRPIAPNGQRYFAAPTSIASALNKQAAGMQLKRSASLDESLSKRQRLEQERQDRLMRKSAYGAYIGGAQHGGGSGSGGSPPAKYHQLPLPQQQLLRCDERPAPIAIATAATSSSGCFDMPFYSPKSAAYTQEYVRRKNASMRPTTAHGGAVCKPSGSGETPHGSAVTIMPRQRPPAMTQAQLSLLHQQSAAALGKPSLEIMRLTAGPLAGGADMLPLTPPPLSPPKPPSRLMGPPLTLLKGRKATAPPAPATGAIKSPPLLLSPGAVLPPFVTAAAKHNISNNNNGKGTIYRSSPPALVNLRNTIPLMYPTAKPTAAVAKKPETPKADAKPKANLREFRPIHKEAGSGAPVDILDLSPTSSGSAKLSEGGDSPLDAALNKLKQNTTAAAVAATTEAGSSGAPPAKMPSASAKTSTPQRSSESSADGLQNLQLLSESALAREKIAIAKTPPLYELKAKLQPPPPMVRQQNASVRNIPNPSALAFRNQQQQQQQQLQQHLATPASTPSSTVSVAAAPPPHSPPAADAKKSTTAAHSPPGADAKKATPLLASTAQGATTTTTTTTTNTVSSTSAASAPKSPQCAAAQSPPRAGKKLTSIDQVAATLNIRAAAAEAAAASTASTSAAPKSSEEPPVVSSTSAEPQPAAALVAKPTESTGAAATKSKAALEKTTDATPAVATSTPATASPPAEAPPPTAAPPPAAAMSAKSLPATPKCADAAVTAVASSCSAAIAKETPCKPKTLSPTPLTGAAASLKATATPAAAVKSLSATRSSPATVASNSLTAGAV